MKKYVFNVDNQDYQVEILNVENGLAQVSVNNEVINIKIKEGDAVVSKPAAPQVKKEIPKVASAPSASAPKAGDGKVANVLKSPLPGILLSVKVKVGDRVKKDDDLVVIEAMKMENNITSEFDGVVLAIKANIGQALMQDEIIIEFGA